MHDHFTVLSTDGVLRHTRLIVAGDKHDALLTHAEHWPGNRVISVQQHQRRY